MQIIHKTQKDYTLAEVTSDVSLLSEIVCFIYIFTAIIGVFAQIIGIIPKPDIPISQKDLWYVLGILIILFLWIISLRFNISEEKNV